MKAKTKYELSLPNVELVEDCLKKYQEDSESIDKDSAILSLIEKFPENKTIESILLKVCVINKLYSTNIIQIYKLAKRISEIDFDTRIHCVDYSLVEDVAIGHDIKRKGSNDDIRFYSFATKYCSWHNPAKFPIYDGYIAFALEQYNLIPYDTDLKRYNDLVDALFKFKGKCNLGDQFNLKQIDKFLWYKGKEMKDDAEGKMKD